MIIFQCFFGLVWGSFSNLVANRIQKQESIIWPASHCDQCNHQLSWWTMIPLISFLMLNGRCHYCHCKIETNNFITELIAFLLPITFPQIFSNLEISIIMWCLFLISCCDINTFLIPSWSLLSILLISIFIQIHHDQFNLSSLIMILIFYIIISIINHHFKLIGNGDVDLIFLMINFLGIHLTAQMIILSSLLAMIWYYVLMERQGKETKIPFVPFISIGFGLIYV